MELVHHRLALFLVKVQPFQGGELPFLGLGLKAVNLPQAFDDVAAFLGKALPHVDADKAVELAQVIVDSQQRKRPGWDIPLAGFFYTSPARDRILHYCHRGREQGPTVALTQLCEAFPNHPDWMRWYSAVTLDQSECAGQRESSFRRSRG